MGVASGGCDYTEHWLWVLLVVGVTILSTGVGVASGGCDYTEHWLWVLLVVGVTIPSTGCGCC